MKKLIFCRNDDARTFQSNKKRDRSDKVSVLTLLVYIVPLDLEKSCSFMFSTTNF